MQHEYGNNEQEDGQNNKNQKIDGDRALTLYIKRLKQKTDPEVIDSIRYKYDNEII